MQKTIRNKPVNEIVDKFAEIALADQEIPINDKNEVQSILCGS